jgi:hypothetical protein
MSTEEIAGAGELDQTADTSLDTAGKDAPVDSSTTTGTEAEKPAASSEPKTAFEAVSQMLDKKRAAEAAKASQSKAPASDGADEAAGTKEDGDTAAEKAAPAAGQKDADEPIRNPRTETEHRFNRVLKLRKQAEAQIEELRPMAQAMQSMRSFAETHGLQREDITDAMELARLLRTDRRKAYQEIQRLGAAMAQEFGDSDLPEDLQDAVADGRLSDEYARELARERAARKHEETRVQQVSERQVAERQQREQTEFVRSIETALSAYESEWRGSDPDFATKQQLVQDRVTALISSGQVPKNSAEAVQMMKDARAHVEKTLAPVLQKRRTETRDLSGGATGNSRGGEPKTVLEAAELGLRRTRRTA